MRIGAINAIVVASECRIAAGNQRSNIGISKKISLHATDQHAVGWCGYARTFAKTFGFHRNESDVVLTDLTAQPPASKNGNRGTGRAQANPAAEERQEISSRAKSKRADVLQKEIPLFRKEQIESRQVDLLLIDLNL